MTKVLASALFLYVGIFAVLWFLRLSLIYPLDPTYVPLSDTPLHGVTERRLRTADAEEIVIWTAKPSRGKPTILYFCGNAGNLANRVERFKRFQRWGFGFVALGYRGSSGSSGTPDEQAITADAIQVRTSLPELLGSEPRGPIVYYGESIGSGVALKLAANRPADGIILEAPFTSLPELAARQLPIFPVKPVLDQIWDNESHILAMTMPTLIIHGTEDRIVPYKMGKALFNLSPSRQKKLITIDGGAHYNLWTVETQRAIIDFLNALKV